MKPTNNKDTIAFLDKLRLIVRMFGKNTSSVCAWSDSGKIEESYTDDKIRIAFYPLSEELSRGPYDVYLREKGWFKTKELQVFHCSRFDTWLIDRHFTKHPFECISVYREGTWLNHVEELYQKALIKKKEIEAKKFAPV